ncbi:hypothetical protein XELAEV_18041194mg [Xenopus laevis]|uniref:Uncharacterized protein n=1 Tax=Xenopus laevis TaxID=8355 RepID=A0A974H4U4_XENLA|nr:hypothetical protein XELAEV_18041194mg [Xenopus laevis]
MFITVHMFPTHLPFICPLVTFPQQQRVSLLQHCSKLPSHIHCQNLQLIHFSRLVTAWLPSIITVIGV